MGKFDELDAAMIEVSEIFGEALDRFAEEWSAASWPEMGQDTPIQRDGWEECGE